MLYIFMILVTISSVFCKEKHDFLLPKFDKRCIALKCQHADIDSIRNLEHVDYFNRQIPLFIHQIWFGDVSKKPFKTDLWKDYAGSHRYVHRLWGKKDLETLKGFMKPANFDLLQKFLKDGYYHCASDIVRYEILKNLGGIYVDCDFSPPRKDHEYVQFDQILPMRGLTVITEHKGRDIGETAIFVCNGIIFSCPEHPVMVSAVNQIAGNVENWYKKTKNYDAMFCTGPFFFNKIIWGTFNVVPITYLIQLEMN